MKSSDLLAGWRTNPRVDILSGLVVALALIPEAIGFSVVAGADPGVGLYASVVIATVIALVGGRATLLPVPAIVGRTETREVLERDPVIAAVPQLGRDAPVACFGLGGMTPDSVLVQAGAITADEIARLRERGAVGDVLGRFVDADGTVADPALDGRTLGLPVTALRDKAVSIAVAAGASKHAVVRAALRARLVNVLVTDERTAAMAIAAADRG